MAEGRGLALLWFSKPLSGQDYAHPIPEIGLRQALGDPLRFCPSDGQV